MNNIRRNGEGTDSLFDEIGGLLETIRGATTNGPKASLSPQQQQPAYNGNRRFTGEQKRELLERAAEVRRVAQVLQEESRLLRREIFEARFKQYYES
jgi:hypothetical protein